MTTAPAQARAAKVRIAVRDQVRSCRRCDLHRSCTGPVPFHAPMAAAVAVLGEAPGRAEDKAGRPFVGPAGQLLRRLLTGAGIDPDGLAWLNTVSCFPDRTPTAAEARLCTPNRLAQLSVLAPTHVLVCGSVALATLRPDLKITQVHGRVMAGHPGGWWVYPVHHPSAALRNPALVEILAADLTRWAGIVRSASPWEHVPLSCVVCGRLVDRYDPDGIGWCANHHARGTKGWEKAARDREVPVQPALTPATTAVDDVVVQEALL